MLKSEERINKIDEVNMAGTVEVQEPPMTAGASADGRGGLDETNERVFSSKNSDEEVSNRTGILSKK